MHLGQNQLILVRLKVAANSHRTISRSLEAETKSWLSLFCAHLVVTCKQPKWCTYFVPAGESRWTMNGIILFRKHVGLSFRVLKWLQDEFEIITRTKRRLTFWLSQAGFVLYSVYFCSTGHSCLSVCTASWSLKSLNDEWLNALSRHCQVEDST